MGQHIEGKGSQGGVAGEVRPRSYEWLIVGEAREENGPQNGDDHRYDSKTRNRPAVQPSKGGVMSADQGTGTEVSGPVERLSSTFNISDIVRKCRA
jgi:hypothetical protein